MQRIVQHLDAGDCLALLRTSRQLGSAVQHRGALTWTWRAPPDAEPNSMQTPQVATAASLLARWAPAELHVRLHGRVTPATKTGTAFSLPATLPPLITRLHLSCMHLTPKAMGSLLHCRRLHTLDIERCTHAAAELQQVALPALPLLHAVRFVRPRSPCTRARDSHPTPDHLLLHPSVLTGTSRPHRRTGRCTTSARCAPTQQTSASRASRRRSPYLSPCCSSSGTG